MLREKVKLGLQSSGKLIGQSPWKPLSSSSRFSGHRAVANLFFPTIKICGEKNVLISAL